MSHVRPLLGVALTAAAIAAAGCGSSSDDGAPAAKAPASTAAAAKPAPAATPGTSTEATATAAGPRPTKAVYVHRADKVCRAAREVSRSANSVVQKAFQAGDTGRAADAIDSYTPLFAEQMQKFKALRRPLNDGKILDGLIKVMDGQVQALRDEAVALRQQDNTALQQISQAQQQELQFADDLGRQYGFKVCGRSA